MFFMDGVYILISVIIVDLTQANFILQVAISWGVTIMIVTSTKEKTSYDRYLKDVFLCSPIKVFGCLHY